MTLDGEHRSPPGKDVGAAVPGEGGGEGDALRVVAFFDALLDAELPLQFQHGSADGGGGELQPGGGAAEVQFLGDRDERQQVPHLHEATVCGCRGSSVNGARCAT